MKLQTLFEQSSGKVILLSGKTASGKGFYVSRYYPNFKHIVVSDIVKKLSGSSNRSELIKTGNLDQQISSILINLIQQNISDKNIVIDGIRQLSIIKNILAHFNNQNTVNVSMVWLDVPQDQLQQQFLQRDSDTDDLSFDQVQQSDKDLGLDRVEQFMKMHGTVVNTS